MPWVRIDDAFTDNRKFLRAGPLAGYLHIAAIAWSNRNLRDGVIPREQPPRLAAWHVVTGQLDPALVGGELLQAETWVHWQTLVSVLIEEGLWVELENGDYEIHDYLDYQKSAKQIREEHESNRKRQRDWYEKHRHSGRKAASRKPNAHPNGQPNAVNNGHLTPAPNPNNYISTSNEVDSCPLSVLLADLIEQNGSRRPRIAKSWRDAERLMLSADGRPAAEAEKLVRWCQSDEFWRGVILSMPKLRGKYDQLRLQMERGSRPASSIKRDDLAAFERVLGGAGA